MKEMKIKITEDKEYKICIKKGIIINLGEHLSKTIENKRIIIITNSLVNCLYGVKLLSSLKKGGFDPDLIDLIEVPDGEKYKSLSTAKYLYDELLKRKADRTTTLIALGGGVIGDLTGFVAATYMRGLPLVHIPTTLLAQVDSSIGGKVAVDHLLAKNIIGSFYQPRVVYTDPEVLQTLSDQDIKNGIVEAIKIAVIKSPVFFKWLEKNIDLLIKKHRDLLCELVKEAVSLKVDIVLKDPREKGLRKVLNFGHSIGHALEVGAGYEDLSHGKAVALGMLIETKIARNRGICSEEFEKQIKHILSFLQNQESKPGEQTNMSNSLSSLSTSSSSLSFPPVYRLPVRVHTQTGAGTGRRKRESKSIFKYIKNIDYNQFWETLTLDKKNSQGKITFILPKALGKVVVIDDINKKEVIEALEEFKKEWKLC
jgi:3-dehydroquinate synthase